jgi:hypothetical protein
MSRLDEVGERDNWRCWLCDTAVDPHMSVNDPRGPSIDSVVTRAKKKGGGKVAAFDWGGERLAHRGCNTMKGANAPTVPWPEALFVVDPAPIIGSVERLERKGGREVMARCPTPADARAAADWLVDRISRLRPELRVEAVVEPGGGQYLVSLVRQK